MNDSQKARGLADAVETIIDRKYKRYARTIAERLDEESSPLSLSAGGQPATRWKEFKSRLRQKPSYALDCSKQFVKKCCSELLKELPADESSVLWLSDTADRGKRDALALELYERVRDLAIKEAEREAFYAGKPEESKLPVSVTSDEIVIPLADFLIASDLVSDLNRNLEKRMVYQSLPNAEDNEEMEEALRVLLDNNSNLIIPEELAYAMKLPRNERGEYVFDRLMTNTSTGWRDAGVF